MSSCETKKNWSGPFKVLTVFFNMVLQDVIEYEYTNTGRKVTKLDHILLNGNNIAMLVPGGNGPEIEEENQ